MHQILVALAVLLTVAPGCEKDEQPPQLTFVSHSDSETIWNTETLQVDVTDNVGIVKVEFFVNGSPLGTVAAPPWEIELNTRSYEDGTIAVSARAYDEEGNASDEATLNLVVENTLLTVTVEEGYLWEDEDQVYELQAVIYLTSDDGEPLGWAIMENGDTKVFKRPEGFNEKHFDLGRGFFYTRADDPLYLSGTLYTYMDMQPASMVYRYDDEPSATGEYVGSCSFTAEDINQEDPYTLSHSGYEAYGSIHDDSAWVDLYEHSNQAYFYLKQGASGYYNFYSGLEPDNHYLIRSGDLSSNMTPFYIDYYTQSFRYLRTSVYGYATPGDYNALDETLLYQDSYSEGENTRIAFHYPTGLDAVKDFFFYAWMDVTDYISYAVYQAGPLPSSIPNMSGLIHGVWLDLPDQVQANVTGSADMQRCALQIDEENRSISLRIRGPMGAPIRIPPIPAQVEAAFEFPAITDENIRYYYHELLEHSDVDGYYPLASHLSFMNPIDPYYSQGTVVRYTEYFDYPGDQKAACRVNNRAGDRKSLVDGPGFQGPPSGPSAVSR